MATSTHRPNGAARYLRQLAWGIACGDWRLWGWRKPDPYDCIR